MRDYTVVYDGNCKVCTKIVTAIGKWDRDQQLEIISSQTPGLHDRFPWISEDAYRKSLQLVRRRDNQSWQGAAAIEQILDVLPKGKFVTWIFSIPFARPIAERVYRWFARNRYHLGCSDHCELKG